MNKRIFEKIIISLMFVALFSTLFFFPKTFAITDIFAYGKGFVEEGNNINETIDTGLLKSTSDFLYKVLLAIAVVIAIVVAMVLGIQFMWASAEEKAKVKEALLPFVVGCFVVFGSFTIWKLAVNIGNDAENQITAKKKSERLNASHDINNDGKITSSDLNGFDTVIDEVKNIIANNTTYAAPDSTVYDINDDGVLNQDDYDINGNGKIDAKDLTELQTMRENLNTKLEKNDSEVYVEIKKKGGKPTKQDPVEKVEQQTSSDTNNKEESSGEYEEEEEYVEPTLDPVYE